MDEKDFNLLVALHRDARQSYQSMGRKVGLSAPAVRARLERLREIGVIPGYGLWVDPSVFGRSETLVFFKRERSRKEVVASLNLESVAWIGWKLEGGLTVGLWAEDVDEAISQLELGLREKSLARATTSSRSLPSVSRLQYSIIDALADDPVIPFQDLIDKTGLSPKTVRKHLEALIESETAIIMPRLGAVPGSGDLVYQLSVAGQVGMSSIRAVMGEVILLHQTRVPEMRYLLCRSSNLGEVTTKISEIGRLPGAESVNLSLNRELFFAPSLVHSLVHERTGQ